MSERADRLLDLVLDAGREKTRRSLAFHMVNRTAGAIPYDRASLWRIGGGPRLEAVSGVGGVNPRSEFALAWKALIRTLPFEGDPVSLPGKRDDDAWKAVAKIGPDARAVWLVLPGTDVALALERWGGDFPDSDVDDLCRLGQGYAVAWRAVGAGRKRRASRVMRLLPLVLVVAALVFVRVPLRVVAPCEVVSRHPYPVTTPMEGVLGEVVVEPGQRIARGQTVAVYEETVAVEELEVARRQADVVRAELTSMRARSLDNPRLRSEAAKLEARLAQETARLAMAESRWNRLKVVAGVDGIVQIDDPRAWRGKPVAVGERIMWLVDPADTVVKIWIPQHDRVDFDFSRPVAVHLFSYSGSVRRAGLVKVGSTAQPRPDGSHAFPAEAEWSDAAVTAPLLGLAGSAVLYGPEVRLGYWLFRKPLAEARRWLGL